MSTANGFFDSSRTPSTARVCASAAQRSLDQNRLRRTSLAGALALLVLLLASLVMQPAHAATTTSMIAADLGNSYKADTTVHNLHPECCR